MSSSPTRTKSSSRARITAWGVANAEPVASPSTTVLTGLFTSAFSRHESCAAGACADWTAITRQPGASAAAARHAAAAPVPLPTGTKTASRSGRAANISA